MKMTGKQMLIFATALALVLSVPISAQAQDGGVLYKAKCAMCHGADGSKLSTHNLQTADVQKMSDGDIAGVITNGKGHMPPTKSLKPEEVTAVVAYVRTLKK
jgi:cytochrome c6